MPPAIIASAGKLEVTEHGNRMGQGQCCGSRSLQRCRQAPPASSCWHGRMRRGQDKSRQWLHHATHVLVGSSVPAERVPAKSLYSHLWLLQPPIYQGPHGSFPKPTSSPQHLLPQCSKEMLQTGNRLPPHSLQHSSNNLKCVAPPLTNKSFSQIKY